MKVNIHTNINKIYYSLSLHEQLIYLPSTSQYLYPYDCNYEYQLNMMMWSPTFAHYQWLNPLQSPNIHQKIINTNLTVIPSTQSSILEWASMFTRPEIYVLSEPNPWQDPNNYLAVPLIWDLWLLRQNANIIVTYGKF